MFGIYRYGLAFCVAISHLWGGMIAGPAAYAVWGFLLPQRLPDDPDSEREVRFHAARPDQVRGQSVLRIYPAYYEVCMGMLLLFTFVPETSAKFLPSLRMPRTTEGGAIRSS